MPDFTVVAAILAGGALGLLLMRWAGRQDEEERTRPEAPSAPEPPSQTGYRRRPAPTAGPVLLAVGLTLLGAGLAIGSGDAGLDARPLIPGVVVLTAALVTTTRRPNPDAADQTAPNDIDPASTSRNDLVLPSDLDPENPTPPRLKSTTWREPGPKS